jgi:hypothetical protein
MPIGFDQNQDSDLGQIRVKDLIEVRATEASRKKIPNLISQPLQLPLCGYTSTGG